MEKGAQAWGHRRNNKDLIQAQDLCKGAIISVKEQLAQDTGAGGSAGVGKEYQTEEKTRIGAAWEGKQKSLASWPLHCPALALLV